MKSDFIGNGPMKEFVEKSNLIFAALTNMTAETPPNFEGAVPEFRINEGEDSASLEFDMGDAYMLDPSNVVVRYKGDAIENQYYTVKVVGGQLSVKSIY